MEFPERISARLTAVIADNVEELSEQKLAEINYGIAVFITNAYKLLFVFILALLLGIFNYFMIAFMSFGALRTFASGVHAKGEWTCLPLSTLFFFGIVYVGLAVKLDIYMISILFALCFAAVLRYAPADTEEKPIVSRKLRRKLKIMSCLALAALYLVSVYTLGTSTASIITFAVLVETILILPVTYKLAGSMYGVGININKKKEV
ncbi:MAG TPA: accessory gene regulator AgrB [Candidatus Nitrosocosmicus sp.]|nr:accessory gene regulator AgrB [Candidatus Nitrosocosmicus sp.]